MQVLFGTRSTNKTFITVKAVSHLELKTIWREKLGIKAFWSKSAEVEMRDVAELSLKI